VLGAPQDKGAADTLRVVLRPVAAILLMLLLLASSCSSSASTSRGDLGSSTDEVAPEPTESIAEPTEEAILGPNVVIAPTPVPAGPGPLIVATLLGETGVLAPLDGPALAGVVAEIDRLNEAGGVLGREIELRRFDMNSRASVTERLALRLVDNPPDLIITSCDTEVSKPALDIAAEYGLLTISPCADDVRYMTGGLGPRNFTMGALAEPRGALAASVALELYGPTAIVLRDVTSPEASAFCDGFEQAFRELGGSVTYRDEFTYDTLEPVEDRLADIPKDAAFITLCSHVPGEIDAAPSIILILRTLGFQAPIVAGSSVDEPGWFSSVPTLDELTFISWSSTFGNDPDDRVNDLVRSVQQNGETSGAAVSTILGAEAIEAWARAVESARDASPDRVAAALGSFNDEVFSTGEVSFVGGARMDPGRTYRVLQVVDGELSVFAVEQTED
jgi:branched-chain amino acid transport system substrate-binding protein